MMDTTPLKSAISTSEGVLVWLSSTIVAVSAAIDPSLLPPKWAAVFVAVVAVAHTVSRTLVKTTALKNGPQA